MWRNVGRRTRDRAVLIAGGIIAFFGVLGQVLLAALGITPAVFSIAGVRSCS